MILIILQFSHFSHIYILVTVVNLNQLLSHKKLKLNNFQSYYNLNAPIT
jgi:hypothetical protein